MVSIRKGIKWLHKSAILFLKIDYNLQESIILEFNETKCIYIDGYRRII